MAEYIERETLEKFVSSVRRDLPLESPDFLTRDIMLLNFEQYIHLMPAVDVVEVVRCKDCIYYNETHEACNCDEKAISSFGIFFPNADDFCSYGERKELDNDT